MSDLSIHDIERSARVRAVTDNLYFWQGLRFIAVGPVLLLTAAMPSDLPDQNPLLFIALIAVAAAITLLATTRFERRYREDFGHVRARIGAHVTRSRVKWLLIYPLMFGSLMLDAMVSLPIFASGFTWALAMVLYQRSTGGGREHYLMLAAALVALGFAPLTGVIDNREAMTLMMLLVGFGMLVACWLDDREMRRVLRQA